MSIVIKHEQKENVTLPKSEYTSIFVDTNDSQLKLKKSNGNIFDISTRQKANYHSATSLPGLAALYQLSGSLIESSGNGLANLSVATGTERYTDIIPGLRGFYFDGSTNINNTASSTLAITDDITLMMIMSLASTAGAEFVAYGTPGSAQSVNYLWLARQITGGNLQYFAEYDANQDTTYAINDRIPLHIPSHLAMVRENQTITFYLNGLQIGATSSTLITPNGGENSFLSMGLVFNGILASVAIYSRSLSADEVKQEYNYTLGNVFGSV